MGWHPRLNEPRPRRQLRARFFVAPDGTVTEKDRPVTTTMRRMIFRRDGGTCQYCGQRVLWVKPRSIFGGTVGHVDHLFPISRGGRSTPDNLVLACERCNESKQAT